jgi:hypothetical protein
MPAICMEESAVAVDDRCANAWRGSENGNARETRCGAGSGGVGQSPEGDYPCPSRRIASHMVPILAASTAANGVTQCSIGATERSLHGIAVEQFHHAADLLSLDDGWRAI